jgi:transposase
MTAWVGDLFMRLIHSCELNRINGRLPTELLRHPAALAAHPAEWMPWNYMRTVTNLAA